MKTLKLTLLLIFISTSVGLAQTQDTEKKIKDHYVMDHNTNPGRMINEIPYSKGEMKGSYHYWEQWLPGVINLKDNGQVEDLKLKYDLKNQVIEVKSSAGVYTIDPGHVKNFVVYEGTDTMVFPSAKKYLPGTRGIVKVIYSDPQFSVFLKPEIKIKESTYNPALDIGERGDEYLQYEKAFLVENKKPKEFNRNLSGIQKALPNCSRDLKKYVKANNLNIKKNNNDLIAALKYCFENE